jgi:hypothetical protein
VLVQLGLSADPSGHWGGEMLSHVGLYAVTHAAAAIVIRQTGTMTADRSLFLFICLYLFYFSVVISSADKTALEMLQRR